MAEENRIRNEEIRIKVSSEEHKIARDKAEYLGLSMSSYIRDIIVNGKITFDKSNKDTISEMVKLSNCINDFKYEINRIGNNINQLVKVIHENNDLYFEEQLNEALSQFETVNMTFNELTKKIYERMY